MKSKKNNYFVYKLSMSSKESNFAKDISDKIAAGIDPDATPGEAIHNIFQSGVFQDMLAMLQTGDVNTLMEALRNQIKSSVEKMNTETTE